MMQPSSDVIYASCKLAIMLVPGPNYSSESCGKCESTSDACLGKLLHSRWKYRICWLNSLNFVDWYNKIEGFNAIKQFNLEKGITQQVLGKFASVNSSIFL